jgi:hypothetical protein
MQQIRITILTQVPPSLFGLPGYFFRLLMLNGRNLLYFVSRNPRFLPDALSDLTIASLKHGLRELKVPHKFNPWRKYSEYVLVLNSAEALVWALSQKAQGNFKIVIAGTGISDLPSDNNRLLTNPAIDMVLLPTEIVRAKWIAQDQYFAGRSMVWSAGVPVKKPCKNPSGICVVYSRDTEEKLFSHIMDTLWAHKVPIVVSNYGQFRSREYGRILKKSKFIIYLDKFDTQPLALYEAWMADVPSLIMRPTKEVCPEECGLSFSGFLDFESKLLEFQELYKTFKPRPFALNHHTDSISAGKLTQMIDSMVALHK